MGFWALSGLPDEGEPSAHLPLPPETGEALKDFKQGGRRAGRRRGALSGWVEV